MGAEQAWQSGRRRFGAMPFAPTATPDFGGPRRFADGLAASLRGTRPMMAPADRVFADAPDHVSIAPRIDLHLALATSPSTPRVVREPATMEVVRELRHGDSVHTIERRNVPSGVEPPGRLHERLSARFERVEREIRQVTALEPQPRRPAGSAPARPAPGPQPHAAMVLHRRPAPAATPQPVEVRRQLPSSVPTPGGPPAISAREISRVADEVISVLNRQSVAWRERFGRG